MRVRQGFEWLGPVSPGAVRDELVDRAEVERIPTLDRLEGGGEPPRPGNLGVIQERSVQ